MWTVEDAAQWFGISTTTVYRWNRQFFSFMSQTAIAGRGECLTEEDAKVLTFIYLMRLMGRQRRAIFEMLHRGKRGELPLAAQAKSDEDRDGLIMRLRGHIVELQTEGDELRDQLRSAKHEAVSERRKREIAECELAVGQALRQQAEDRLGKVEGLLSELYLKNGRVIPPARSLPDR